ncbi:MAG: rhomboid family intramembrane serine protease [Saprospiraceae bacterium]|nr:rhomboid family intramembrane serine protease [Saprospiraceae bacterium]MCB0576978.1 rhomboid family intramembrane serine protease [Saprospiraceae bacterium]MCB9307609.1 rhomboid family intramembrane serine protease [Lewinellaceae bacterium]
MKAILESESDSLELTRRHLYESIQFPLIAVAAIWLVHLYQVFSGFDPGEYGIMSRRLWGLRGIITGPLVHGSWGHLISNTLPLFVLSALSIYFYRKVAMRAFWMIYLLTGAAVWLFARPVSHIGASGVIYGLVAFIFWNGIFRRSMRSIILAALVVLLYSGMFMGILPDQEGISWESHLLGSLVGIFTSFWFKEELEDDEADDMHADAAEPDTPMEFYLPRDIFNKTKAERQAEAEEAERLRQQQSDTFFPPFWNQDQTW